MPDYTADLNCIGITLDQGYSILDYVLDDMASSSEYVMNRLNRISDALLVLQALIESAQTQAEFLEKRMITDRQEKMGGVKMCKKIKDLTEDERKVIVDASAKVMKNFSDSLIELADEHGLDRNDLLQNNARAVMFSFFTADFETYEKEPLAERQL